MVKKMKNTKLEKLRFQVHLTDHCNLNCIGCNHFSPIAKEFNLNKDCFEKDCKRIIELTSGCVSEVILLGGEPLLHPNICPFLKIAAKYFSNSDIILITNGILLLKQTETFWKTCNKCNVRILITEYPINIKYIDIKQVADKYNVTLNYAINRGTDVKIMECTPLDVEGKQDMSQSFQKCYKSNNCITLKDGKLYTCCTAPFANNFIDYYKAPITISNEDSIDIYKAKSIEEILYFLSQPIPFCKYCDIENTRKGIEFSISQKKMSEWT